jgi:HEAT repeat protein
MRPSHRWIVVSLLGLSAVVGYSFATRTNDASSNSTPAGDAPHASRAVNPPIEDRATPASDETVTAVASAEPASAETLAQWILNTRSTDEDKRAAAIVALGQAPKAEAVPALQRVLENGAHERDRQIALRSLHTLAIRQGDDDQRIRDAFRSVIHHGDDEGVSQSAQAFLEDFEEVLGAADVGQPAR